MTKFSVTLATALLALSPAALWAVTWKWTTALAGRFSKSACVSLVRSRATKQFATGHAIGFEFKVVRDC